MARNRQRSKQRQAERRARRLQEEQGRRGDGGGIPGITPEPVEPVERRPCPPRRTRRRSRPRRRRSSRGGGPKRLLPRADEPWTIVDEPRRPSTTTRLRLAEEEALEEIEDWEVAEDFAEDDLVHDEAPTGAGEEGYAVRGRRGRDPAAAHKDRPRVIQFLIAVWAELQRVQWPNRQALVTLTGVVLGFVLIAGGYLGLLDAIFSELIKQIL